MDVKRRREKDERNRKKNASGGNFKGIKKDE
jgi:hypothetical protein